MKITITRGSTGSRFRGRTAGQRLLFLLVIISCLLFISPARTFAAASVRLSWTSPGLNTDHSALHDLAGFRVYMRTEPNFVHDPSDIVAVVTDGVVPDPAGNEEYSASIPNPENPVWLAVTAVDSEGNESGFSTPIMYYGSGDYPVTVRLSFTPTGASIVAWNSVPGASYRIQFKADLKDTAWSDLTPNVVAGDSLSVVTNTPQEAAPHGFFRVIRVSS